MLGKRSEWAALCLARVLPCVHGMPTTKLDTYQRILDAGRELIRMHAPVSARAVAARTKMSTGTVTYYFRRADQLIDAVCSDYLATMGEFLSGAKGHQAEVLACIESGVSLSLHNPQLIRAITRNAPAGRAHAIHKLLEAADAHRPATKDDVDRDVDHSVDRKVMALIFMLGVEQLAMMDEDVLQRCTEARSTEGARAVATRSITNAAATLLGAWQRGATRTPRTLCDETMHT